jgi:PPM family protein phosphatase
MSRSSQPTVPASEGSFWRRLFLFNGRSNAAQPPVVEDPPEKSCVLEAFGYSDKGYLRPNNEDYFRIEPQIGFYAVADGMGGAEAGEYASRLAVDVVAEHVVSAEIRDAQLLVAAMEEANRRVVQAAKESFHLEGMGTTLLVGLARGKEICISSVGDSRVYLQDPNGLRRITQDQSWMEVVGRLLGLDEESLKKHPMRNVLTMAIGHGTPLTVNHYAIRLEHSDTLLMCTDGLHGVVSDQEIENILRITAESPLETKCHLLIGAALAAGGPDNISVVLVRLKPDRKEDFYDGFAAN